MMRAVLLVSLVVFTGCSEASSVVADGAQVPNLIDLLPEEVAALEVATDEATVQLMRSSGRWLGEQDEDALSATFLMDGEDRLFPLAAYRELEPDDEIPGSGLRDPTVRLKVIDVNGEEHRVEVGDPSFNGAGFYAAAEGSPTVHLISRGAVALMLSVARGERFEFPDRVGELVDAALDRQNEGARDGAPRRTPWLEQALDAGVTAPDRRPQEDPP